MHAFAHASQHLSHQCPLPQCSLPQLLLHCLEECTEAELKRFKWHLIQLKLEDFAPISRSRLEKMDMLDLVDGMLMAYSPEGAVKVVLHVLRNMQQNELVRRLLRDSSLRNYVFLHFLRKYKHHSKSCTKCTKYPFASTQKHT